MKKTSRTILAAAVLMLAASTAYAQVPPIDEDAMNAFGISFSAYIMSAMMMAFGQEVPGFEMEENEDSATMTFDNLDLTDLGDGSFEYTSISGTITAVEAADGVTMEADLMLQGGPVKKLQWSVEEFDMEDAESEAVFTIIADGKRYRVSNTDFMM